MSVIICISKFQYRNFMCEANEFLVRFSLPLFIYLLGLYCADEHYQVVKVLNIRYNQFMVGKFSHITSFEAA